MLRCSWSFWPQRHSVATCRRRRRRRCPDQTQLHQYLRQQAVELNTSKTSPLYEETYKNSYIIIPFRPIGRAWHVYFYSHVWYQLEITNASHADMRLPEASVNSIYIRVHVHVRVHVFCILTCAVWVASLTEVRVSYPFSTRISRSASASILCDVQILSV